MHSIWLSATLSTCASLLSSMYDVYTHIHSLFGDNNYYVDLVGYDADSPKLNIPLSLSLQWAIMGLRLSLQSSFQQHIA